MGLVDDVVFVSLAPNELDVVGNTVVVSVSVVTRLELDPVSDTGHNTLVFRF